MTGIGLVEKGEKPEDAAAIGRFVVKGINISRPGDDAIAGETPKIR